jgi:hypothetical protein
MGGACAPGRLVELLGEAENFLAGESYSDLAEAVEEARERLEHPEKWVGFPLVERPSYTCEGCGRTFQKTVTDETAAAEAAAIFPAQLLEDKALVCDDCFRSMMSNFVAHYEQLRARAGEIREMSARSHGQIAHHVYLDELLTLIEFKP